MLNRLLLLVLAFVLAAPLASAAPDVVALGESQHGAISHADDPLPELSIDDVTVAEGDSGTVTATFTVTLSAASDQIVEVAFATADDTASAPDDYLPAVGPLVFDPGQTTQSVSVTVNGDTLDETNETYFVNLSNAVNATIADSQGL
ncbi:MAG TPA: Calx-beta domain-containing protein, partial [Gaiellaceae bacterium]|nr:Calx-beta domain-containing protein [Gaiellaceae bacterium]